MSIYQKIAAYGAKYFGNDIILKYDYNCTPMYRRSTAKILRVSRDLLRIDIVLPISYRNRNFVNTIFGGSMFSAVDPIPMVQLINLLDDRYIIWDKSAEIAFKRPARQDLYATFSYAPEELEEIRRRVAEEQEIEIVKTTRLTNREGDQLFCEVKKTIYVADKAYFRQKRARQGRSRSS